LHEGGVGDAQAVAEAGRHPIGSPEAWWAAVMGSGYRGTIGQLAPDELARVHAENLDFIRRAGIEKVEANVVYAWARKSPSVAGREEGRGEG